MALPTVSAEASTDTSEGRSQKALAASAAPVAVFDPMRPRTRLVQSRAVTSSAGLSATADGRVVVEGLDADGEKVRIEAEGLLSRCLQHEIDHLDGVLFIDRVSPLKRKMLLNKWSKRPDKWSKRPESERSATPPM